MGVTSRNSREGHLLVRPSLQCQAQSPSCEGWSGAPGFSKSSKKLNTMDTGVPTSSLITDHEGHEAHPEPPFPVPGKWAMELQVRKVLGKPGVGAQGRETHRRYFLPAGGKPPLRTAVQARQCLPRCQPGSASLPRWCSRTPFPTLIRRTCQCSKIPN